MTTNCELCGEPMPEGEEMFKYHGYSSTCPKPPLTHGDERILTNEGNYQMNAIKEFFARWVAAVKLSPSLYAFTLGLGVLVGAILF